MHVTWKLLQFKCKGEKEQRNEHPVLKVLVIISKYGENMEGGYPFKLSALLLANLTHFSSILSNF